MVCHRHVKQACIGLGSLLRFSAEPIRLLVHDDGTLTDADRAALLEGLPGSRIVTRTEADSVVNEQLAQYALSRAYRDREVMGIKLFDIPLMSDDEIAHCDSDIRFFRPFTGLYAWPAPDVGALFMQDWRDAYVFRPWHLLKYRKLKLLRQVNAGLMLIRQKAYELDFIEWLLSKAPAGSHLPWIEQTCWSALGARAGARLWDPRHIALYNPERPLPADLIAGHFTSQRFLTHSETVATQVIPGPVCRIATIPAVGCGPLRLAINQATHPQPPRERADPRRRASPAKLPAE